MKNNKIRAIILSLAAIAALTYQSPLTITAAVGNESEPAVQTKKIALTFDDGPHPQYTAEVLNVLKEKDVPATFFTVGYRAETLPHLILKMQNQGCVIGNHTYDHKDLTKLDDADVVSDLERCSNIIFSITGGYPKVYRPPFGKITQKTEACLVTSEVAMSKVMWDIDSLDWKTPDAAVIVERVCRDAKDGDVILMHDFYPQTVESLPVIIDTLREKGFEFVIFDNEI